MKNSTFSPKLLKHCFICTLFCYATQLHADSEKDENKQLTEKTIHITTKPNLSIDYLKPQVNNSKASINKESTLDSNSLNATHNLKPYRINYTVSSSSFPSDLVAKFKLEQIEQGIWVATRNAKSFLISIKESSTFKIDEKCNVTSMFYKYEKKIFGNNKAFTIDYGQASTKKKFASKFDNDISYTSALMYDPLSLQFALSCSLVKQKISKDTLNTSTSTFAFKTIDHKGRAKSSLFSKVISTQQDILSDTAASENTKDTTPLEELSKTKLNATSSLVENKSSPDDIEKQIQLIKIHQNPDKKTVLTFNKNNPFILENMSQMKKKDSYSLHIIGTIPAL